jgi:hypothetical protein
MLTTPHPPSRHVSVYWYVARLFQSNPNTVWMEVSATTFPSIPSRVQNKLPNAGDPYWHKRSISNKFHSVSLGPRRLCVWKV